MSLIIAVHTIIISLHYTHFCTFRVSRFGIKLKFQFTFCSLSQRLVNLQKVTSYKYHG